MNILIIGSEGFIGKNIVNFYLHKNVNVAGVDVTESTNKIKYFRVSDLTYNLNDTLLGYIPDICFYCGGSANVQLSIEQPYKDFLLNVERVSSALDGLMRINKNCKFINISSAAVYGNPKKFPVEENCPFEPVSPYGWHKFQSENLCQEYFNRFGIPTCSVRPFSIYGSGQRKLLFWDVYQKVKKKEPMTFFGTGNETRDFIYIEDFVKALDSIIMCGEFNGDCYNIAFGEETTIKMAISTFLEILEVKHELIFTSIDRNGDPGHWHADISKLKRTGFTPSITLKQGLQQYKTWLKENA